VRTLAFGIGYITMSSAKMKERKRAILKNRIRSSLRKHGLPGWNRRDVRQALDRWDYVTVGISGGDLNALVRMMSAEWYGRYLHDNGLL
jgi:hypothetical protein